MGRFQSLFESLWSVGASVISNTDCTWNGFLSKIGNRYVYCLGISCLLIWLTYLVSYQKVIYIDREVAELSYGYRDVNLLFFPVSFITKKILDFECIRNFTVRILCCTLVTYFWEVVATLWFEHRPCPTGIFWKFGQK